MAEVLLQQTQAPRIAERYEALLSDLRTPGATVALGKAGVLVRWRGLGYNSRAVRLFNTATILCERFGGEVPTSNDDLLSLPGVGPYTAAAIEVFAFERDRAVYDTNVARVIARAALGTSTTTAKGWEVAERMVPPERGWHYNQALLDLGATICTSRSPLCGQCPLATLCQWHRAGNKDPDPARRTAGTSRPQGTFKGSAREARGKTVEALRSGQHSMEELIAVVDPTNGARVQQAVGGLMRDGIVKVTPNGVTLA
ncbi:MAG: A/G-specific adenine glycosylase [Actinomycetota bacterium]